MNCSILGSCVVRDAIALNDKKNEHSVKRFIQSINPVSAINRSPIIGEFDRDKIVGDITNFDKRNIDLDLSKNWFNYINEDVDYLLVDAGTCRQKLVSYGEGRVATCIFDKPLKNFEEIDVLPQRQSEFFLEDMGESERDQVLKKYVECLKKIVPEERIIVTELHCVYFYIDRENQTIKQFDKKYTDKANKNIDEGYRLFKKYLPNAHYIPFPANVVADQNHKWGKCQLHFVDEYYKYLYDAINVISWKKTRIEEELLIYRLKYEAEDKLLGYFNQYTMVSARENQLLNEKKWFFNAMTFFEKLSYDMLGNNKFISFIKQLEGKKVCIMKVQDRAGILVDEICKNNNINVVLRSKQFLLSQLSEEEVDICKNADIVINCHIHSKHNSDICSDLNVVSILDII